MWAGCLASLLIGLTLGLIGGGGSILTVPVLVYLLQVDAVTATAYSLFIVGATSLAGVFPKYRNRELDTKAALLFGLPSMATVFLTRKYLLPAIPDTIGNLGGRLLSKGELLLLLFALLMIVAAFTMITDKKARPAAEAVDHSWVLLFLGAAEGCISGLVGAGGGFLIIPALVLLGKLPMKKAIGTSLLIIAVKSLVGFTGDLGHFHIQWSLLLPVTALAVAGIFAGSALASRIAAEKLKKGFGWFVIAMGLFILWKEGRFIFS